MTTARILENSLHTHCAATVTAQQATMNAYSPLATLDDPDTGSVSTSTTSTTALPSNTLQTSGLSWSQSSSFAPHTVPDDDTGEADEEERVNASKNAEPILNRSI